MLDAGHQALAIALIVAQPTLEWLHPLGAFHEKWSYESGPTVRIRELLGSKTAELWGRSGRSGVVDLESLDGVTWEDLRELIAALMVHHLRQAGKTETVSRETVAVSAAQNQS